LPSKQVGSLLKIENAIGTIIISATATTIATYIDLLLDAHDINIVYHKS